jgi:tetratricopeptide (TPR) repeat protein
VKLISLVTAIVCVLSSRSLYAQSSLAESPTVSLYQLAYKPEKKALRLLLKGNGQLKQHQYNAGLRLFQEALAIDSRYWNAENNLGYAYLKLSQIDKAEQAFKRDIEIDPLNAIGYTNLSVAALNKKDYLLAEKSARQALHLNPQLPEPKALFALAQVGQGNWSTEAHRLLEESYQSVPGSDEVLRRWPESNSTSRRIIVLAAVIPK